MPLVDKLERIGVLLQNGTLSPEEFHQAKDHLLKTAFTGAQPLGGGAQENPSVKAAREHAKREYLLVRHHCLVRDCHFALREPRVTRIVVISVALIAWLGLGGVVVAGFLAVSPALAVIPMGTILVGVVFMLGAICSHAMKVIRLQRAKRRYSVRSAGSDCR
jgi:hypothetical protein